jgi:hypothetical protein
MKRTIATAALFVASLFTTAGIWAQAQGVKANVPWGFTINDSYVPAGTYTISPLPTDHLMLEVSNREHKVDILSMALDGSRTRKDNVLVFHKYGDQYFLTEIRSTAGSMELSFPTSKAEKRARTQTQEAGIPAGSDVVLALY